MELGPGTIPESDYIYDFSFPKEEGKPNPHLWTNPPMAKRYAEIAADELAKADPADADYYHGNYERFAAKVDELDQAMRTAFATIPREDRKLLTYHDAYAYFGQEYGWDIIGAIQVSDFEDPTAREVAQLIDQVKAEGVPAIFGSEVFPSPVLEQIGREAGVKYVDVLRDDDLPGAPGDPDHSWLGLMRFDFITMTEAMGGDASALKAVTGGERRARRRELPAVTDDLLRLGGVSCRYAHHVVLDAVDLCVEPGSFTGVVGPSGSGKTTLLRVLTGSMVPFAGVVRRRDGLRIGYVPQVETVNWHFPVTVAECVLMGRMDGRRLPWRSRSERR